MEISLHRGYEKPSSGMNNQEELANHILQAFTAFCSDGIITRQDLTRITNRILKEGISFALGTLRTFGKEVDLALGQYPFKLNFTHVRKKSNKDKRPVLFYGLLSKIFDTECILLKNACPQSIRELRQLCFIFSKFERDFTTEVVKDSLEKFRRLESDLTFQKPSLPADVERVIGYARDIITDLYSDYKVRINELMPKHGPGATSERIEPQNKMNALKSNWYRRLHDRFPFYRWGCVNSRHLSDLVLSGTYKKVADMEYEGVSDFCLVQKDIRGPRTITMEPVAYQYIQQGIRNVIVPMLEERSDRRINFQDQGINRALAYYASLPENSDLIATVDLEDASDRLTNWLVEDLFRDVPDVLADISSCRTRFLSLERYSSSKGYTDGDDLIPIKRFAGMGSGLCFPIMGSVLYALTSGLINHLGDVACAFTRRLGVHVYGDDIIVGSDIVGALTALFKAVQLRVSEKKTFHSGFFKESCGGDYFLGHDVTPVRVKRSISSSTQRVKVLTDQKAATSLISTVALHNNFYAKGYISISEYYRKVAETVIGHKLPFEDGNMEVGYLHTKSWLHSNNEHETKYCKREQRLKKKVYLYDPLKVLVEVYSTENELDVGVCNSELMRKFMYGFTDDPIKNFSAGQYTTRDGRLKVRFL